MNNWKSIGWRRLEEGCHELFNTGDGQLTHFDEILYEIVKDTAFGEEMAEDRAGLDYLGNTIEYRVKMRPVGKKKRRDRPRQNQSDRDLAEYPFPPRGFR